MAIYHSKCLHIKCPWKLYSHFISDEIKTWEVLNSWPKLQSSKSWSQESKRSKRTLTPEPIHNLCVSCIRGKCYPPKLDLPSSSIIEPSNFSWPHGVSNYIFQSPLYLDTTSDWFWTTRHKWKKLIQPPVKVQLLFFSSYCMERGHNDKFPAAILGPMQGMAEQTDRSNRFPTICGTSIPVLAYFLNFLH